MTDRVELPSFEIVRAEDASHAAAKRLRIYVAIAPAGIDRLGDVATTIVDDHAANNDVVVMFFYFTPESAGKSPAEARAQYVRNGMKQGFVPKPLTSDRKLTKLKMPRGVLTVETAREPEIQADADVAEVSA